MSSLTKAAAVAGMAALLVGCATAAQRQLMATVASNRAAGQEFQACVAAIYNQPELAPLRRDLAPNVRNATLEQLANQNFVSDEEIKLILANHPKLQVCRQQLVSEVSQTMPTVAPILVSMTTAEDNATIELLQRKLRWGEFVQRLREVVNQGDTELAAEGRRILAGLQQAHEEELAQRQAAAQTAIAGLANAAQTWQANVNAMRPVITNCRQWGYQGTMTSCMTY
jgi:hypothetical protein